MNIPFNNPLFLIPVMTGVCFVLAGLILIKFPPKEINSIYGYRTKNSMKSKERWTFAQKFSAVVMTKFGALLALSGLLGVFFHPTEVVGMLLGLGLLIITVIALLLRVEIELKKRFKSED